MIQWERVLRWRQRTAALTAKSDPAEGLDFFLALFANIFQMRDWLKAGRRDLEHEVSSLFKESQDRGHARDLANGSKHMEVTSSSVDSAASVAREYVGGGGYRYVVPRPGGRNVDAGALADACIDEVRRFMKLHDLVPNDRLSEAVGSPSKRPRL